MDHSILIKEVDRIRNKADTSIVAYTIIETEQNKQGYIPCIIKEGIKGYFRTDWNWGKDKKIAEQIAIERNDVMGLSTETVEAMIAVSMFG
jgi:hypothetical protein